MMKRIKAFLKGIWSILWAIFRGRLLIKLKMDYYIFHIAWVFVLFAMMIGYGIAVDNTLVKVQKNKKEIIELEIKKAEKAYELECLKRITTLEQQLEALGSDLRRPQRPLRQIDEEKKK